MRKKVRYRVQNWKDYNRSLINRGNLTLWVCEDAISSWYDRSPRNRRGRRYLYSSTCIELALTLRTLFHLPLRSTQGFLEGLVQLMGLELRIPHYTRLSRRAKDLKIEIRRFLEEGKEPCDIAIDSTGLKIYGEGEWKMRTHGKQKRRTWRKYHVAIDPKSHEVIAMELTPANVHDCKVLPTLLDGKKAKGVYADGAYTIKEDFDAIAKTGGKAYIPVRTGTCIVKERDDPSDGERLRNELIRETRKAGGKTTWKKVSGYHKRSLVETHMYRLKSILGSSLRSREIENQKTEACIMANILNVMTAQGMPQSVPI